MEKYIPIEFFDGLLENCEIDDWMQQIKQKSLNKDFDTVIYSISDINYKSRFDEMICTFDVPKACFAMCAFDRETYDFFISKNIPTILLDKNKFQFNHLVFISKIVLTDVLLQNKWNVIMNEADIFWKADVYKLFETCNTEMMISSHRYSDEVNFGFYRVLSNENTIRFFNNMLSWIYDESSGYRKLVYEDVFLQKKMHGAIDQKLFDCALRQCNDSKLKHVGYSFSQESLDKLQGVTLDWKYISCEVLMHYPIAFPNNHVGFHIWSGYSTPENQIKYAHGYEWYYNMNA
jgi:hypothetical protein